MPQKTKKKIEKKETKSQGLSLPPLSHHPHELYSEYGEEAFSEHKSTNSIQANYNNHNSVAYSPMNFRPANQLYQDPRSAGPSPMAYGDRRRPPPNWDGKFNPGFTPSTAGSGMSPYNRYYAESPAFHTRNDFIKPRLMATTTPKSTFGGYYSSHHQMPMASPYVRSATNKFSNAPKNAHNFSTYFQQPEIIEDAEESD